MRTAESHGWDTISNGDLLTAAERAAYDILITTDQSIPHQQNLKRAKMGLVILTNTDRIAVQKHISGSDLHLHHRNTIQ